MSVASICEGLEGVDPNFLVDDAFRNMFNGISVDDIHTALAISASAVVNIEPNYSYVASRIVQGKILKEAKKGAYQ